MSDKLNKQIGESMLEGLLSDEDKPKPPAPAPAPSYYGGGWSSRGYGYDDEEAEDESYYRGGRRGYPYNQPDYAASQKRQTSIFDKATPSSTQATSYSGGKDISAATINSIKNALEGGLHSGQKHYYIPPAEQALLVAGVVRALGEVFDAVGLCWGAGGSKAAIALMNDMLMTNMFYNTPTRGYKELDFGGDLPSITHDPVTGEVLDAEAQAELDEERKAIMEVDGGNPQQGE